MFYKAELNLSTTYPSLEKPFLHLSSLLRLERPRPYGKQAENDN